MYVFQTDKIQLFIELKKNFKCVREIENLKSDNYKNRKLKSVITQDQQ